MPHPQRDHHAHTIRLLNKFHAALKADEAEPIEVASAALIVAITAAHRYSRLPADEALHDLLDDLYAVYIQNN
jgi:hypothetical protein